MSSSTFTLHMATEKTLDEIAREGAGRMLAQALEQEVQLYIQQYADERDEDGHRVVRNGFKPPRTILTGSGPLEVRQPRVDDRRTDEQRSQRGT